MARENCLLAFCGEQVLREARKLRDIVRSNKRLGVRSCHLKMSLEKCETLRWHIFSSGFRPHISFLKIVSERNYVILNERPTDSPGSLMNSVVFSGFINVFIFGNK